MALVLAMALALVLTRVLVEVGFNARYSITSHEELQYGRRFSPSNLLVAETSGLNLALLKGYYSPKGI